MRIAIARSARCARRRRTRPCNERVAKMRDAHQKAAETCKSAQPDKHREHAPRDVRARQRLAKCEARCQ
jgi:hypothetical protein